MRRLHLSGIWRSLSICVKIWQMVGTGDEMDTRGREGSHGEAGSKRQSERPGLPPV